MTARNLTGVFDATRPSSIALLTFMVALGQMSLGLYLPSMPAMASALGADRAHAQLTLTVFLGGFGVAQLFWGPLADRFGRRITLIIGLCVFAAAGIACALAQTVTQLVLFRFFQALGACAGQVVARAAVRDSTEGAGTATVMTYIALSMSISPAITPALGGFLQTHFGWRASFVALGLVGVTLLALVMLRLPETLRTPVTDALSPRRILSNYGSLLTNRNYVGYVLVVGGVFGGLMAYSTISPFLFMEVLGWSPQAYGLLVLFNVAGYLAGSVVASRIGTAFGIDRMARLGAMLVLLASVAMSVAVLLGHLTTATVIAPMMLYLFGMAFAVPNAMAGALQPFPRIAGSAAAFIGFSQMSLGMVASWTVGHADGEMHVVLAAALVICAAICALSAFLIPRAAGANHLE